MDWVSIDRLRGPGAMLLDVIKRDSGLETERRSPSPEAVRGIVLVCQPGCLGRPVEHDSEGRGRNGLPHRGCGGKQEWCGLVWGDPRQHVSIQGPGSRWADAVVLQRC